MRQPFIEPTGIDGLVVINPAIFQDDRGYFYESYNKQTLEKHGLYYDFVQDNQARSVRGVLRGLHFQTEPYAQAKLVRVIEGEVYDVAVDVRPQSPTYGKWFGVILSAANKKQLMIPRGFAHGYLVLSDTAEFFYKCDNYYSKAHEDGIIYNDPNLAIDWQIPSHELIISPKDQILNTLKL
jgi:dTDP-4-dehydrorhamnose 3,5-epimerase